MSSFGRNSDIILVFFFFSSFFHFLFSGTGYFGKILIRFLTHYFVEICLYYGYFKDKYTSRGYDS